MAAWPAGTASNQARSRQSSERGQTIQTLREAQEIESVCSPEDFEVGDTGIEPPAEPPPPETNVVVVDFRRRFRA
jgi:hypothetical protein